MISINAGDVTVAPARLHGISADDLETSELKAVIGITDIRPHDVAKDVRLAPASRAWAGASQHFQTEIRFGPVIPLNGQLVSDLLNVLRFQPHEMSIMPVRLGLVDLESNSRARPGVLRRRNIIL